MIGHEIHSWSLSHQVNYDLNESLLLKSVTGVIQALNIGNCKQELGFLVPLLTLYDFPNYAHSIHSRQNIPQIPIL